MPVFIALLRAVNVGGTGKLPMAELKALCAAAGFTNVETYIASGNLILEHPGPAAKVKEILEARLLAHCGRPVTVHVRTPAEIQAVLDHSPFPDADPRQSLVIFLDQAPPWDWQASIRHHTHERLAAGAREIYVDYSGRMSDSRLIIPAAAAGTARNRNTVAKLCQMASARL